MVLPMMIVLITSLVVPLGVTAEGTFFSGAFNAALRKNLCKFKNCDKNVML